MDTRQAKYREGKTAVVIYAPDDVHYDFKMICVREKKSIKEVLLTFMCAYIKEKKNEKPKTTAKG